MSTMKIQDFEGLQYAYSSDPIERKTYDANNVEYATSTYQVEHDMFPGLIAFPKNDGDIQRAVKYARDNGHVVAVMSGGHQYSGACSTHKGGIQLNLKLTYKGDQDLVILPELPPPDNSRPLVRVSVSHDLGTFNQFLAKHHLFVPHGQCTDVRLGGHAQTGGYGQLGRSFGLLGDHIWAIRLIDHQGEIIEVTKKSDPDLFYAILGGSPGNFGVITHYTIEAHRDADHDFGAGNGPRPHGFKAIWLYNQTIVKLLLNEIAAMADDPNVPRNFDLCVSVLSSSFPMFKLVPELKDDHDVLHRIADALGLNGDTKWPASVVLYAQWVPMHADDGHTAEVDGWFQRFRNLASFLKHWCIYSKDLVEPMSQMTGEWLFRRPREFDYPYVKRAYLTDSTTLTQDKWVDAVADRIHLVLHASLSNLSLWENCFLSVQIQCFGGKFSQFAANRHNGTSYSWRDSTVCQTLDCFHTDSEKGRKLATEWQARNDELMSGEGSPFSKRDRRVLWASYGDWDMEKSWPFYFEDRDKYERIGRVRGKADPLGTFSPNPFNVRALRG